MIKKVTQSSTITLVELPPSLWGTLDGIGGWDVYTKFKMPPRALPALASVLMAEGYNNVRMVYPPFHGSIESHWSRISKSDILMVSAVTRTSPQSMGLIRRYNLANPAGTVIVGGMDPSYRVTEWLDIGADIVVIGEGEATLSELMKRLRDGSDLVGCLGIAYKDSLGDTNVNDVRPYMTPAELSNMPTPFYDEAISSKINTIAIEQERGCPYSCDFCVVTKAYGHKVRCLSPDAVLRRTAAHGHLASQWFFTGDNFAANPREARAVCEAMINSGRLPGSGTAQVSAQARNHPELLKAMRHAGFENLCIGFESVNDAALGDLNKPFNAEQNTAAARTFGEWGFWRHGMMMVGADSDNLSSIRQTLEWAQENTDTLQLFAPTPFAGTPLHERMTSDGRIITTDHSLYDCQHVVIQPNNMSAHELQKGIFDAYRLYYSPSWTAARFRRAPRKRAAALIGAYVLFGGLKGVVDNPQSRQYLQYLKDARL